MPFSYNVGKTATSMCFEYCRQYPEGYDVKHELVTCAIAADMRSIS